MSSIFYFERPGTFFTLQDPGAILRYYDPARMSREEMVELARGTIGKLGVALEDVLAEQEPVVVRPEEIAGLPSIPRLQLEWAWPNRAERSQWIQVEVDAERGTVESILVDDTRLWGKPPLILDRRSDRRPFPPPQLKEGPNRVAH
ncbi:MAG: hypothetical protein J0M24_21415 [Verrucomicrobia bacterium]|nr:hypothetical protein [Verrucomicrobiota bacterium]